MVASRAGPFHDAGEFGSPLQRLGFCTGDAAEQVFAHLRPVVVEADVERLGQCQFAIVGPIAGNAVVDGHENTRSRSSRRSPGSLNTAPKPFPEFVHHIKKPDKGFNLFFSIHC